MKTNYLPAIVMLAAGFLDCIFGIVNRIDTKTFVTQLLIVLVVFYVIGVIIRIVLDMNFKSMNENAEEDSGEESEPDAEQESVQTDKEI